MTRIQQVRAGWAEAFGQRQIAATRHARVQEAFSSEVRRRRATYLRVFEEPQQGADDRGNPGRSGVLAACELCWAFDREVRQSWHWVQSIRLNKGNRGFRVCREHHDQLLAGLDGSATIGSLRPDTPKTLEVTIA